LFVLHLISLALLSVTFTLALKRTTFKLGLDTDALDAVDGEQEEEQAVLLPRKATEVGEDEADQDWGAASFGPVESSEEFDSDSIPLDKKDMQLMMAFLGALAVCCIDQFIFGIFCLDDTRFVPPSVNGTTPEGTQSSGPILFFLAQFACFIWWAIQFRNVRKKPALTEKDLHDLRVALVVQFFLSWTDWWLIGGILFFLETFQTSFFDIMISFNDNESTEKTFLCFFSIFMWIFGCINSWYVLFLHRRAQISLDRHRALQLFELFTASPNEMVRASGSFVRPKSKSATASLNLNRSAKKQGDKLGPHAVELEQVKTDP
jgi:hypothetical protein